MKLIAIDMDGTLVNNEMTINKDNVDAIKQAQQSGIEVVIATGRSYDEAITPVKEAGLTLPIICINGAQFRSSEGEVLDSIPISTKVYADTAKVLEAHSIYYELYTNKGTYSNDGEMAIDIIVDIILSSNPELPEQKARELAEYRVRNGRLETVESYSSVLDDPELEIYKLLSFSRNEENLKSAFNSLLTFKELAISSSAKDNIEITHRDAQKGIALQNYAEKLKVDMKEAMAIGDNYNDVSMFELVHHSVAMGNAVEDIKKLCSFTTKTNDESGVAHAIQTFLTEDKAF
ncbi:Cof-type HAD-IIB family hydrolase [Alkalihalobacillus sp. AL-G]|uniref:Cof-type HAD-IIB family hydrolase n=1 Tax=Alkalihalobacillus sp. AL-G TaxID=2926399 RepID=UPI002729FDB3|nr:Cof-type HAD-IIB family hydrolase [Alkalihalobacillus sp. AL-G]WLD94150.1 Cof-type HAD-IIB family hydrolase [Alkalihalobacillus sp. AL-G]